MNALRSSTDQPPTLATVLVLLLLPNKTHSRSQRGRVGDGRFRRGGMGNRGPVVSRGEAQSRPAFFSFRSENRNWSIGPVLEMPQGH